MLVLKITTWKLLLAGALLTLLAGCGGEQAPAGKATSAGKGRLQGQITMARVRKEPLAIGVMKSR